jgi:hypothetical protein
MLCTTNTLHLAWERGQQNWSESKIEKKLGEGKIITVQE